MPSPEHPIRRLRRLHGLTAEQLAAKAEVASATVYRAERGISEPTRSTRRALADALGVQPDELVGQHEGNADTPETPQTENREVAA